MKINFVNHSENEVTIERAHEFDAGVDLRANGNYVIEPGTAMTVSTGIHMAIPENYVGLVFSRSGHGKPQTQVNLTNAVGVIDSQYRGEIMCNVRNNGKVPFKINNGDRIAQLLIMPIALPTFEEVPLLKDLGNTTRGEGGFGSTGVN